MLTYNQFRTKRPAEKVNYNILVEKDIDNLFMDLINKYDTTKSDFLRFLITKVLIEEGYINE